MSPSLQSRRGFTLLEILVVAGIAVALLSWAVDGLPERILNEGLKAEDAQLEALQRDIVRSFDSVDFDRENIAALVGDIPPGTRPTRFSEATDPIYPSVDATDWFAKIAHLRGFAIGAGPPTTEQQPGLAMILFNRLGRARLLLAAPPETTRQRFLLVSLYATPEKLALPVYDGTPAFFDAIWNTEWNTRSGSLPQEWRSRLTADEVRRWTGGEEGSNLYRLRVIRITLPRYTLNVSNGHSADSVYLYWNNASSGAPSLVRAANSGSIVSPGILSGRVVVVSVGATEATASEKRRIQLRQNTDVLVQ